MANSDINRGANILASLNLDGEREVQLRMAAQQMGISEQEGALLVRRALQKAQRRQGGAAGLEQVVDTFIRRGAAIAGLDAEMPGRIDDLRTIPNEQVVFGESGNQDELQNFGGLDEQGNIKNVEQAQKEIERARGKRDSNLLTRTYFEKGKEGPQTEELYIPDGMPVPARFVEAAKDRDFGIYREDVAAPAAQVQRIERDALQQGVDQFGADAFPGVPDPQRAPGVRTPSAVDVIGRIDDDIRGNSAAERSLVREMVARDRQRQNSEVVEANNWRAQAAANLIGQDFTVGGPGARADQAIENIGHIAELGPAKIAADFAVSQNPVDRGTAIPNALPLNLPDQYNAPVTDNRFAGPLQRQEQWLVDAMPGYVERGAFGRFDDVSINEQMGIARAAIQNAQIRGQNINLDGVQIRNLTDLQAAADQVLALGRQNNVSFFNNVDGKNVYNPNPGIGEVLERGGLNARQIGDVAKGAFAVEAAMKNPVNQVAKNFYGVGMGQPGRPVEFGGYHPDLGGGDVDIAMLGREKIEGKEVKAELQKLSGRGRPGKGSPTEPLSQQERDEARMPFQAGVAGEGVKRARFVRSPVMGPGPTRLMSSDEIYERFGPVNGQIANAVIQRAEQAQGSNPDGFGVRVERQRNMDPGPTFDVGPDPWSQPVGTGNGIAQERARRSSAKPQAALPYGLQTSGREQGPTRPLTTELKNELAALSSGFAEQGPRPASNYSDPGIKPDGPTFREPNPKQVRAAADYRKVRRYGRNSAIAGGAALGLAGIDGLVNGERKRREEEAQY